MTLTPVGAITVSRGNLHLTVGVGASPRLTVRGVPGFLIDGGLLTETGWLLTLENSDVLLTP